MRERAAVVQPNGELGINAHQPAGVVIGGRKGNIVWRKLTTMTATTTMMVIVM
jgi:hypothetical protein